MLFKIFEELTKYWSAVTLQIFILAGDLYLFNKGYTNIFIFTSATLILTLFCLQFVSRRFLLMYPFQGFAHRRTDFADTKLLGTFMILSISCLVAGVLLSRFDPDNCNSVFNWEGFYFIGPAILLCLPLYWLFKGRDKIIEKIVNDLKEKPLEYIKKCPICKGERTITRTVIEQNLGEIEAKCENENCADFKIHKLINVGY
jgi:hypothetical protein